MVMNKLTADIATHWFRCCSQSQQQELSDFFGRRTACDLAEAMLGTVALIYTDDVVEPILIICAECMWYVFDTYTGITMTADTKQQAIQYGRDCGISNIREIYG